MRTSETAARRRTRQAAGKAARASLRFLVLMVAALSLAAMLACSQSKDTSGQSSSSGGGKGKGGGNPGGRGTPVGVAPVQRQDVAKILTGLGTITAYNTVTVRSRVDGQLIRVNFTEGQMVKSGDLLAMIDPRAYQVALQQARAALARDQAQYNTAQANLVRVQKLVQEGVFAQQQLDTQAAETGQLAGTIQVDQAQIENAQLNLSYTSIRAPLTGRVGLRLVDVGNMVHANDPNGMLVITQMQPIAVLFALPEDEIPQVVDRLHSGLLPVDAYDRDDKTKLASGKLETIDNQIDQATGTVRLKAVFDNRETALWPNQFVNVHLQLQTLKDATVIPASAVQRGQQGAQFVYAVDASNTAQMRNVQVVLTQGDIVVLSSGVSPGERVVTDGQDRLQSGMKVEPTAPQGGPRQNTNAGGRQQPPAAGNGAAAASPADNGSPNGSNHQGSDHNSQGGGRKGRPPGGGSGER